jgi:hypothetical protein
MPNRTLAKAYKDWLQALDNMRAALTANPLVADPLMASAQVFEDIGRMMFGSADKPKKAKRAKSKRAAPRKPKKPAARAKRKR